MVTAAPAAPAATDGERPVKLGVSGLGIRYGGVTALMSGAESQAASSNTMRIRVRRICFMMRSP